MSEKFKIMWKDIEVVDVLLGVNKNLSTIKVIENIEIPFHPFKVNSSYKNIVSFLESRRLSLYRPNRSAYFHKQGMSGGLMNELRETRGVDYDDFFWIKFPEDSSTWDDVNPRKRYKDYELAPSKGMQYKWRTSKGKWFKKDYWGYEAVTEHIVSNFLEAMGYKNIIKYDLNYADASICESKDFLKEGYQWISFDFLCRSKLSNGEYNNFIKSNLYKQPVGESIEDMVNFIHSMIEIPKNKIQDYLEMMFYIDSLFLNTDRHLNNFGFFINEGGKFSIAPLFDFGNALMVESGRAWEGYIFEMKTLCDKGLSIQPLGYNAHTLLRYFEDFSYSLDVKKFLYSLDPRVIYTVPWYMLKFILENQLDLDLWRKFKKQIVIFESNASKACSKIKDTTIVTNILEELSGKIDPKAEIKFEISKIIRRDKLVLTSQEVEYLVKELESCQRKGRS